jgi:hypothetical protein
MNATLAHLITQLYPRSWRERYGDEFAALLIAQPANVRTVSNVIRAALGERISPTVLVQDCPESRFASWCRRAPWAVFTIGPLLFLAVAYLAACLILWSGWQVFLPGARSPFVRIDGLAMLYFGAGRLLYFAAPVWIGWCVGILAIRHHVTTQWPRIGLALVGLLGGAAQVQVTQPLVGLAGRVSMRLALGENLAHTFVILALIVLPYTLLRLQRRTPLSS